MRPRSMILLVAVVGIAVALVSGAAGGRAAAWTESPPTFVIQPHGGERPRLDLSLALPFTSRPPARIAIYVPKGFAVYVQRPAGAPVGDAELYAVDDSAGARGSTLIRGQMVARALDAATEALLQECSPRAHLAVWELSLNLLGQPLTLPIAISAADEDDRAALRLEVCPPALSPSGTRLPISNLALSLWRIRPPRTHGRYVWRLEVTPAAADGITPVAERMYELRALVPVPQTLTLRGRYRTDARLVTLKGSLREAGKPIVGARVRVVKLARTVTPGGVLYRDALVGVARTDANGEYVLSAPLGRTAGFIATVDERVVRCPDRGVTPGGCRSQTIPGAVSDTITISVPR